MNIQATYRNARISAFKAREVTREIQGLPATDAMDLLRHVPKKAASLVRKTLASAIANAENNASLDASVLTVREAVVGEGPTIKRFIPKARGSAGPIRKRTSHIKITVTDELPIERRDKTSKRAKGARKTQAAAEAAAESPAADKPHAQE